MDQQSWVTDKFYSHFPSYSDQSLQRVLLSKSRKQDYQNYLSRVAVGPKKSFKRGSNVTQKANKVNVIDENRQTDDESTDGVSKSKLNREMSSKQKAIHDRKHINLPDILDENKVHERNQRMVEETRKKKLEYNRDLLEQIELKKKETERLKAKEKEDDERLTRKLEEQLKRVMLEEQKEKEKMQRYQSRQVNQSSLVPKLEKDVISRTKRSEGRKALSENGKEDLIAPKKSDKDLYKYFTNSARETQHLRNVRYNPYLGIDDLSTTSPQSSTLNRPVEPHWKRYPAEMEEPIYSTCSHHGHDDKSEAEENSLVCSTCQSQLICRNCDVDFCLKCRKRKKTERNRLTLGTSPRKHNHSLRPRHQALTETTEESEFEQEVDILIHSPIVVKSHSNPFSMNLGKSSVFHPSRKHTDSKISVNFRNGDVFVEQQSSIGANMDEMKRITDEKLSKYAKNYSDLRSRRSRVLDEDTFPMPLIRENTSKMAAATATDNFPMEQNSPAFKTLETKWQIPAVQKNTIAREPTNNTRVLTQVGAFRKQLQLDQLEFDNIPSNL